MQTSRILFTALFATVLASAQTCDRACLKTTLDTYMKAILKHDPAAAPLSLAYRHTENAILKKLGEGAWKSITAIGNPDRRYFDPSTEQAAFFGVMNEGAEATVVTVRIRVENRKISEGEWYIARKIAAGINGFDPNGVPAAYTFNPETLGQIPPEQRVVPAKDRLTREELVAITNSYFDAITGHDGTLAMAHAGCSRQENGGRAGGDPLRRAGAGPLPPAAPGGRGGGDCVSGLQNFNLQNVQARRYPMVDVEAQIVLAYAVFIRRPGSPSHRNVFAEWFLIDDKKIRNVYSTMFYPDNDQPVPNWPPYDGNFPLPKEFAPPAPAAAKGTK
ncbi:MAG: hypothetical protein WDO18_21215 [Acidobacteriota bacterium]